MARPVRFVLIGAEHPHAVEIAVRLSRAGAELAAVSEATATELPFAPAANLGVEDALALPDVDLAVIGVQPTARAGLAEVAMRAGKDVICPKPAVLSAEALARLRAAHRDTGRVFTVWFSERVASPSTLKALDLVEGGAIGRVVHVLGLGPHRLRAPTRPAWFFDPARAGGLLADLLTHQIDQFLLLAGGDAEVVHAEALNVAHPELPGFQDLGVCHLRGANGALGVFKVDWLSPEGLGAWGDVRLAIQGTEGTIEVRKVLDVGGAPGADHLILVDGTGVRRMKVEAPEPDAFFASYLGDLAERTETAIAQTHVFRVCELAIAAQAMADGIRRRS